ncbi:MAG: DUF3883 domain-containing protein [Fibromonadales bacterium]|nr:DUF3883 domain-containing protein [Fibromonadales bacterium]
MFLNSKKFYEDLCENNILDYGRKEKHLEHFGNLYADNTHFIYELLQNAEDAKAKSILFQLFDDRLEILHNGQKFSEENVKAITQIAESAESEYKKIGKFGLGFKSVYAITDIPQIYSGDFHFNIEKYIRPSEIPNRKIDDKWTTLFVLPFKIDKKQEIYEKISKRLQNTNVRILLFLTYIEEMKFSIKNICDGKYLRKNENKNGLNQIVVTSQDKSENLFVFDKEIDNKKVEIAFLYDEKENIINKTIDTDLVVYFPTAKKTNLGFLLHGNFNTTPARDNILEDDKHNNALVKMAAELLVEAMQKIKSANLCNISFLESLPIIASDFPESNIFYPLFKITANTLKHQNYLPMSIGGFISAEKAIIAATSDLIDLYEPDGKHWLSKEITEKYLHLYNYLRHSLGIEYVTPDKFANRIDENFLHKQSDDWFIKFYIFLNNGRNALWRETPNPEGVLRSKPILRLEDNTLKTPKEEVFLPIENSVSNCPMIKSSIATNEEALAFLKVLGLDKPEPIDDIIQRIFPKYKTTPYVSEAEYKNDLNSILTILKDETQDEKNKLKGRLQNLMVIKCSDEKFRKPSDVYCNNENMKKWFKYSSNIHFANNILNNCDWKLFNVADLPRKILLNTLPNGVQKAYFPRYNAKEYKIENYDLDGLNDFIININPDDSQIIANVIVSKFYVDRRLFDGEQDYSYNGPKKSYFKNNIHQILNNSKWILGNDGKLYEPKGIIAEDIAKNIAENIININLPFDFKKNEEKELEENLATLGKKIVNLAEYEEFQKWKELNDEEKSQDLYEGILEPQYSIDETTPIERSIALMQEDKGIGGSRKISFLEQTVNILPDVKIKTPILDTKKAKEIGQRGEDIVKKFLIDNEGFNENDINILNNEENVGTGRDFEVKKNGEIIKIIEVKSTVDLGPVHTFPISGKQWETGRREQDKFWIYAVFNVWSKEPIVVRIQNPIKQWKYGDIEAQLVNLISRIKS